MGGMRPPKNQGPAKKQNGEAPGRRYHGCIGYRSVLGRLDRLLVLFGKPLTLAVKFTTPGAVADLQTTVQLLVNGKAAHRGSRVELADTAARKGTM